MKVIPIALATHYQGGSTTLARCWKCTRQDGVVFGFTSTDVNIVFEGVTYEAATGFTPSDMESSASLAVSNLEVAGMLDSSSITEADLTAGLWDDCEIEIFEVNYRDLTMGRNVLGTGTIGNVSIGRQDFTCELRGLAQRLQQTIGSLYSRTCRAELFSVTGQWPCGLNADDYEETGSVTATADSRSFTDSGRAEAANWFRYGKVTWLTGDNAGLSMEVKTFTGGAFGFQLQMPYPITVGDTYLAWPGCDHMGRNGDCKNKFGNYPNFKAEEDSSGNDDLMKVGGT